MDGLESNWIHVGLGSDGIPRLVVVRIGQGMALVGFLDGLSQ
jgi:hypothetical protein